MTLVAIHQPNFFPWLGWFNKLARADVFILLDNCQLQLTGGNYTNRVKAMVSGKPRWLTVPIERGQEARSRVDQAKIVQSDTVRRKLRATLAQSYARAPHFAAVVPLVDGVLGLETDRLCDLNIAGILCIADALGQPRSKIRRASEIPTTGSSTDRLIELVTAVGGDAYLTGHGAGGYQDDAKIARAGIEVIYQSYRITPYPQVNAPDFTPGLSVIDAMMNVGAHETAKLVT